MIVKPSLRSLPVGENPINNVMAESDDDASEKEDLR